MKKAADPHVDPEYLKPTLETLLKLAKSFGADGADCIAAHGRSLSIGVREGQLEDIDNSEGNDIGLRVFIGKRQACVSSSDLSKSSLSKLAERAVAMAKLAPEDIYCGLAPSDKLAQSTIDLDVFDPTEMDASKLFDRAIKLEKSTLEGKNIRQAEGANAHTVSSAAYFMTSDGFAQGWRSSQHGLSVSAIAATDDIMERDYDYAGSRHLSDLPTPEHIGQKAARRANARLGSKRISSGTMPILFERRVAAEIISAFNSAISGPSIARGVSFLKDKMGEQVFASNITITDDPFRLRGLGSHPWDGEGVCGQTLNLIENGVLNTWLLNSSVARQLDMETTGHASRGMSAPPGVAASNTFLHAGPLSPHELIKDIQTGLQITEMFGPSINPNTGDFSVGVAGFAIEGGEATHPVSEVTIAGNLLEMFKTLVPANDLVFNHPLCAPSVLIDKMVVAGD